MLDALKSAAIHSLQQLENVVEQMNDSQYAKPLAILFGSTLGMHVRHILEFYICFLNGERTSTINYDARERDLLLENDTMFTLDMIRKNILAIQGINESKAISLFSTIDSLEELAAIPTSTLRELTYLIEHAIHHMAIVKMALSQNFKEINIPENFGIAYSTIKYKALCAQ